MRLERYAKEFMEQAGYAVILKKKIVIEKIEIRYPNNKIVPPTITFEQLKDKIVYTDQFKTSEYTIKQGDRLSFMIYNNEEPCLMVFIESENFRNCDLSIEKSNSIKIDEYKLRKLYMFDVNSFSTRGIPIFMHDGLLSGYVKEANMNKVLLFLTNQK